MGRSISPPNTYRQMPLTGPQYAELNKLIGNTSQVRTLLETLGQLWNHHSMTLILDESTILTMTTLRVTIKDVNRDKSASETLVSSRPIIASTSDGRQMNVISVGTGGQQLFELNQR